ncbi:MAG: hypothetical protein HETSPECPRED_000931 [Heterodermia speciosa]|uniref:MICOS complex subunit mic19 n=1 Tax=Heterodermia speciosa TaxID=116794 RepID=A0A8H3EVC9_9LECA|nr:MAG: hypothetical protein HETSPECPRED_000931 [Heterodermia speciosa]
MGQASSKPSPSSTEHVFTAETPVSFSPDLVNALQASPETDSTRASDLELHIQRRVAAELSRLSDETSTALSKLEDEISSNPEQPAPSGPLQSASDATGIPLPPGIGADSASKKEDDRKRDLGRQSVQAEIDNLKKKLQARKIREEVAGDKGVEKAKTNVVNCLRENDRRPLDCWREVDAFKFEVGRIEKSFLGRVWD